MSNAQCCPVCGGRGKKLATFYPDIPRDTACAMEYVTCRGCNGSGVIVVPTTYPPMAPTAPWTPTKYGNPWS